MKLKKKKKKTIKKKAQVNPGEPFKYMTRDIIS